jgi:hypothetical protein
MRRFLLVGIGVVAAVGCGGTGYNRGALAASLRAANLAYVSSNQSVEEIERTKPQLALPARIAVAPPTDGPSRTWSPDEVRVIESWAEPLRAAGIASELLILPAGLVDGGPCDPADHRCRLRAQRTAAARTRSDALLIVNLATSTDQYANPASLLYATLVGLWVVPGTHQNALTIAEGVLLDNRNEYLYAFARGEGEDRVVRPVMYADESVVAGTSRVEALRSFGDAFVAQARGLTPR